MGRWRLMVTALAMFGFGNLSSAFATDLEAGDEFQDCDGCPVMVVIPPGDFLMGLRPEDAANEAELQADENSRPQLPVTIDYVFAVGKFEVTREEYLKCFDAGACENRPVANVVFPNAAAKGLTWHDAKAYVTWLAERTGRPYRLLSEAEWEYVARAGTTTTFWWGDDVGKNRAAFRGCCDPFAPITAQTSSALSIKTATIVSGESPPDVLPVGTFPPNPFGLHDTSGNVAEWVEDCGHLSRDGQPRDGSAWISGGDCILRGSRGGSVGSRRHSIRNGVRAYRHSQLWYRDCSKYVQTRQCRDVPPKDENRNFAETGVRVALTIDEPNLLR